MDLTEVNAFVPLIGAVCYTLLLIAPFVRRNQQDRQTKWLLTFLVLSVIWEFLLFFAPNISYPPRLPLKALLTGTLLLGVTTAVHVEWPRQHRWLLLGGSAILAALSLDLLAPNHAIMLPSADLPLINVGETTSYLAWFGLSGYILVKTWRSYQRSSFPWHANRLLYWLNTLLVTFAGELLLFSNVAGLNIIGQVTRLVGVIGLAYAVSSHRLFDVRTRAQRLLAFIIITLISALPIIAAVLLVPLLAPNNSGNTVALLTAVIVTVGLILHQPFHRFVEGITYRYLLGEGFNQGKVVRDYSQAISRTLDMHQLSSLVIGMISELLQTNRGALMLVTEVDDGLEIRPIPAMGQIPHQKIKLDPGSCFIKALIQQHQPLLQYELDFNPDYADLSNEERAWLNELAMEAYIPIGGGKEMNGLIAIGPKNSGVPYQPGEMELVQILADQTIIALQNARLYSELGAQNEKIRRLNVNLVNQNERLEIMDRVKSDFITIASHELRTPLTQVKGYSDILSAMNEENALTREQTREIISHVNRATLRLEGLITAMLDASQLDAEGMQLTFVETRLDTILRLAVEPLIQAMRERRISLEMDGIMELPVIYADFKRLVQAFTNLIGNAVKYTPDHGNITVQARMAPTHQANEEEYIELVIADTGIGIDPKFHELIFEKFFRIGDPQLHSTGNTKFKGAGPGLGLPIAKGVIEAHGGRIWVESEGEDEERLPGSHFHIILPVRPPGFEANKGELEPAPKAAYLVG
jgi:signal transduction histidine kinase